MYSYIRTYYAHEHVQSEVHIKEGDHLPEMSEAKKRANKKWNQENMSTKYDHAHILLPKGRKAEIQAHAVSQDESLNAFVNRAINEAMERDKNKTTNN